MRRPVLALGVILLGIVEAAGLAHAQMPARPRYQPVRPTVTPYLNLTAPNFSGVPNYYSLVRPMMQQEAVNQRQGQAIVRQQQELQRLEYGLRVRPSAVPPTGVRSGYLNYSHFYPSAAR